MHLKSIPYKKSRESRQSLLQNTKKSRFGEYLKPNTTSNELTDNLHEINLNGVSENICKNENSDKQQIEISRSDMKNKQITKLSNFAKINEENKFISTSNIQSVNLKGNTNKDKKGLSISKNINTTRKL